MRALGWLGRAALVSAVGMVLASVGAAPNAAVASVGARSVAPLAAPGAVHAKAVTTGFVHSCALTLKGAVRCWGYNGDGELGNNTTADSAVPLQVYGLSKGVKAISAGAYFTCALTTKGAVLCWGSNSYGQLGDNTTTNAVKPVAVYGLNKGVKSISAGNFFACAVLSKGAVKCWGANTYGQLGDGTTTNSAKPVAVAGLTKAVLAVGGGGYHSCAVTSKRAVKCWGYNAEGELGDNTKVNSSTPVAVYGLSKGVKAVVAGSYDTCALTTKGGVKCWGYNGDGELGDGTTTGSTKPVAAFGLSKKVKAIAYGDIHGCAVTTSGQVKCWGYNGYGALGDNTTTTSNKPVGVYDLGAKAKAVAGGGYHSCALTTKGLVKCWGFNAYGELGNGTVVTSHKPVALWECLELSLRPPRRLARCG
jgi:alpha-tubulin suppressor-like RCC1 family protein